MTAKPKTAAWYTQVFWPIHALTVQILIKEEEYTGTLLAMTARF